MVLATFGREHRVDPNPWGAMSEAGGSFSELRQQHPFFFWGSVAVLLVLLTATTVMAVRVPLYRREQALLNERMTEAERQLRDRILDTRARRSALALELIQRELRLKAMQEDQIHLALSTEDSTLALRHGPATLREVCVAVGADSVVRARDGRTWRIIRALGERHLAEKQASPRYTVPEWVYVGRGQPVPPEAERRVEGALGRYVLRLDDGAEIYSRPESGPFAEGVKPGAFVAEEEDLRAIFDAIERDIPVYIY